MTKEELFATIEELKSKVSSLQENFASLQSDQPKDEDGEKDTTPDDIDTWLKESEVTDV